MRLPYCLVVALSWVTILTKASAFPDHALRIDNETKVSTDGKYNPDKFGVTLGDQPRPPTNKFPRWKLSEISGRPRYPKSKNCRMRKKNGKSVAFGTPPGFKLAKDQMQTLEAGDYGHRVELKCPFRRGCPKAKAFWYKDGKELEESAEKETGGPQVLISRSRETLIINNKRDYNDGNYTCVIRNIFGSINHTISVKSRPRVVAAGPVLHKNQPGNHSQEVGSNVTLLCQLAVNDPGTPYNIKWYKHYQVPY